MQQPDEDSPLVEPTVRKRYKSMFRISLLVLTITFSSFYFGYALKYFSTIKIDVLLTIFLTSLNKDVAQGLLNACIPAGALIGALSSSIFIRKLSRRKCILFANGVAFIAGSLIFIENFYLLIVLRIAQGFCAGFYSAIAPLIVNQLAPIQLAGTLGTFTQLSVTIGIFFAGIFQFVLAKIFDSDEDIIQNLSGRSIWQVVFGFPLLTILTQTILLIFVYPYETPKYLLLQNDQERARKLIEIIYKPEYVDEVLDEKKQDIASIKNDKSSVLSETETVVFSKIPIFVAIHLAFLQQMSGINSIITYSNKIIDKAYPDQADLLATLINFEQIFATLLTSFLLGKFGRKFILQSGTLFEAISLMIIAIGFLINSKEDGADNSFSNVMILFGLFLFMLIFGLSLGPVVWLYIPEIVQPSIIPYSTAANWIGALLTIFLFPIIAGQNPGPVFFFFTAWCLISFVMDFKLVVQTKGKKDTEIRRQYAALKVC